MVDFWAPWCAPCNAMSKTVDELGKHYRVGKVNVEEEKDLSVNFNIRGIPCLVFFKDGKEVKRVTGMVPRTQLESIFRSLSD